VELLVILLDNSIKYSDENTTITISTEHQKLHVLTKVKDEGYGISESDLAHVFDRFYRGKVSDPEKQVVGYGLGLSIAQRITELHRGSMSIDSELGKGTTITIKLPLARTKGRSVKA